MIEVKAHELGVMLNEVAPEGVFYQVSEVHDEEEARTLMKLAETYRKS